MDFSDFLKIQDLKWIPFVGENYFSISEEKRILIIGESHYHDGSEHSITKHNSVDFTRIVINEMAIERNYYGSHIFPNFHKALLKNDNFDSLKFWNLLSFYNFIQRPMNTNKSRPTENDFFNGWKIFFEIIKILKPKTCLFIGTSAANFLSNSIINTTFTTDGVKWEDFISNAYAKRANLFDIDKNQINLIFIRHASSMFSWSKWNHYLTKKIGAEIKWIEENI